MTNPFALPATPADAINRLAGFKLPPLLARFNPLQALPAVINHLLKAEPWARGKLIVHAGKMVQIQAMPFSLRLGIDAEGYCVLPASDAEAAVTITIPLSALPRLAVEGNDVLMRSARVEGDADLAQTVSLLAQNLRWEAEEDLSKLVGDQAAVRMVRSAQGFRAGAQEAAQRLAENLAEYWLEENPQLVRPRHVESLADDLRTLRDDLARLEKRVDLLTRRSG